MLVRYLRGLGQASYRFINYDKRFHPHEFLPSVAFDYVFLVAIDFELLNKIISLKQ